MPKPILILQLRPEDDTSDGEFAAILKYGELDARDVRRLRIEHTGIPKGLRLDNPTVRLRQPPGEAGTRRRRSANSSSVPSRNRARVSIGEELHRLPDPRRLPRERRTAAEAIWQLMALTRRLDVDRERERRHERQDLREPVAGHRGRARQA